MSLGTLVLSQYGFGLTRAKRSYLGFRCSTSDPVVNYLTVVRPMPLEYQDIPGQREKDLTHVAGR